MRRWGSYGNCGEPFFLYFPHYGVHSPLQAKEEMVARYEQTPKHERQGKPVYAAMVESIDQSVGRVLSTLGELSLTEKTVVIFTSDNGGFWKATSNAPLRANKGAITKAASVCHSLSNGRVSVSRAT